MDDPRIVRLRPLVTWLDRVIGWEAVCFLLESHRPIQRTIAHMLVLVQPLGTVLPNFDSIVDFLADDQPAAARFRRIAESSRANTAELRTSHE